MTRRSTLAKPLAATGICTLGWLCYWSVMPWAAAGEWPSASALIANFGFAGGPSSATIIASAAAALPAALLLQLSAHSGDSRARPIATGLLIGLFMSLIAASGTAHDASGLFLGTVVGILAALSGSRYLDAFATQLITLRRGLVLLVLAPLVVPVATDVRLTELWSSITNGSVTPLPQHFYTILKTSILWVPVGLLYTFAGEERTIRTWSLAAGLAFLLELPAHAATASVGDLLEVSGAFLGIFCGVWTATRLLQAGTLQTNASRIPLHKRGTKEDLADVFAREPGQIPPSPLYQRGDDTPERSENGQQSALPLWKRGTEGDLADASRPEPRQTPTIPLYERGNDAPEHPENTQHSSFPLWKRGTEGDLADVSGRERRQIPPPPLYQRGEDAETAGQRAATAHSGLPSYKRATEGDLADASRPEPRQTPPLPLYQRGNDTPERSENGQRSDLPLWKRGTEGDLADASRPEPCQIPTIPLYERGDAPEHPENAQRSDFPLWKRGTEGDLRRVRKPEPRQTPTIPLYERGNDTPEHPENGQHSDLPLWKRGIEGDLRRVPKPRQNASKSPIRSILAITLTLVALAIASTFPAYALALTIALTAYALVLLRYPDAWLLAIPALLPALNLAPSTGRFFLDEFDLVMLVTAAAVFWHGAHPRAAPILNRAQLAALAVFSTLWLISMAISLLPLDPVDANAFSSYWSHYNSLRVGKGLLWALVLLALWRWRGTGLGARAVTLFAAGATTGMAVVGLVAFREHWLYAGPLNFSADYRITATFSSMHTGGGHIEAYLVATLPLVWLGIQQARLPARLVGILVFVLGIYATVATIARGGVLALGVVLVILAIGALRSARAKSQTSWRALALPAVLVALTIAIAVPGIGGDYFQRRWSEFGQDADKRLSHWRETLALADPDWTTPLFGMGLGTFPVTYLINHSGPSAPATYRFESEPDNAFLRLGAGTPLYMTQRLPLEPGRQYTLALDLRSASPGARVETPVCERHLLDSKQCQWFGVELRAGEPGWQHHEIAFSSGTLGAGRAVLDRATELTLYNPVAGSVIDIDNVRVSDSGGRQLIQNGDFNRGSDHWFFKTHDHLPWHIKNLWVALVFELGWLGLLSFAALCLVTLLPLARAAWQGNPTSTAALAGIVGILIIGLFDTLFDTPRLMLLLCALLWLGAFSLCGQERQSEQRHA